MREFLDAVAAAVVIIVVFSYGWYVGSIDGEATGRRACPEQQGQEVVAMTPDTCMYASAYGRGIQKVAR